MRLLFVADGRSPTALNWISYFLAQGYEVHLASTFDCSADPRLASFNITPAAFSELKKARRTVTEASVPGKSVNRGGSLWGGAAVRARTLARQWLGPLTLPAAARRLRILIEHVQPHLVHAMRIPYEGMLAALAQPEAPLLISIWGNDFTLHAPSTPLMRFYTRLAMQRAAALHADCRRDVRLARAWGFAGREAIVLPGAGGIQLDLFTPKDDAMPGDGLLRVINPRGIRSYVRNDTFFQAIPLVLAKQPQVRFLCPTMAGDAQVLRWVDQLGIAANVELLPQQKRSEMAALFQVSQVVVSPSTHDGTPNTLLEAMACGCFPVVGDLESLREWITPGVNGLLVDAGDAPALAQAILSALEHPELRTQARKHNARLIAERAEFGAVMAEAERFYQKLTGLESV